MKARLARRVALAPACAATLPACDGALLDLGTADAGRDAAPAPDAAAPPPSCPFIASDSDYQVLRGVTCGGACENPQPLSRDLSAPDVLAASLTGGWTVCSGSLGPSGTDGLQFFPGCVFFFTGTDGGLEGSYATYDVVTDGAGRATGIVLHAASGDIAASVSASACLGRARLVVEAGAIDLASLEPPDAAVAK